MFSGNHGLDPKSKITVSEGAAKSLPKLNLGLLTAIKKQRLFKVQGFFQIPHPSLQINKYTYPQIHLLLSSDNILIYFIISKLCFYLFSGLFVTAQK